jgi:hypothetical protein
MKFTTTLFLLLFSSAFAFSQKGDYKTMRENITKLSCKPFDSLTVVQTNLELIKIDTTLFDKNLDLYFQDLGWSYYRLFLHTKDTVLIQNSIDAYLKADLHKSNDPSTLWELAHLNYIIKECLTGKQFLEKFKKKTKIQNEEKKKTQIQKICPNNEADHDEKLLKQRRPTPTTRLTMMKTTETTTTAL